MDTKLRTFIVNIDKYKKFSEIQRNKGKDIGSRLNELIEKEVKEADSGRINKGPVKEPHDPSLTPNPFQYTQPQANTIWLDWLADCSFEDWKKFEKLAAEINDLTKDRKYIENHQRVRLESK